MKSSSNVTKNKQAILELAKSGCKRPNSSTTKAGAQLCRYANKSSKNYDPTFAEEIQTLRPDWFTSRSDLAQQKKEQILEIARNGEERPKKGTKLNVSLYSYIDKNGGAYDPEFDKTLQALRPDWFITSSAVNKATLLKMAQSGEKRPNTMETTLGRALSNYTSQVNRSYDAEFDKKIRALCPDWFRGRK